MLGWLDCVCQVCVVLVLHGAWSITVLASITDPGLDNSAFKLGWYGLGWVCVGSVGLCVSGLCCFSLARRLGRSQFWPRSQTPASITVRLDWVGWGLCGLGWVCVGLVGLCVSGLCCFSPARRLVDHGSGLDHRPRPRSQCVWIGLVGVCVG